MSACCCSYKLLWQITGALASAERCGSSACLRLRGYCDCRRRRRLCPHAVCQLPADWPFTISRAYELRDVAVLNAAGSTCSNANPAIRERLGHGGDFKLGAGVTITRPFPIKVGEAVVVSLCISLLARSARLRLAMMNAGGLPLATVTTRRRESKRAQDGRQQLRSRAGHKL